MSWLSDLTNDLYRNYANVIKFTSSVGGLAENDISRFWESEANKSDLRGAQLEGFVSGLPIAGDIVRGIEGVNQMEDLYNNTGKVVNYPGSNNLGTSSLGHVPGDLSRKIEDGSHDLATFYSGDPTTDVWTQMSTKANWNKTHHTYNTRKLV